MVTLFSGDFRSPFDRSRNSSKEYDPRPAPSAIADKSFPSRAGSANVAALVPASARAALPAARRKTSGEYVFRYSPKPVKTMRPDFAPGTLMTSSGVPVAPRSATTLSNFLTSTLTLPDSITRVPFAFALPLL